MYFPEAGYNAFRPSHTDMIPEEKEMSIVRQVGVFS